MTAIITYEEMKNFYNKFRNNPPKDEFEKYYQEYSYARSLIDFAKKKKLEKDIIEYEKIKQNAMEQLKKLGYKFI